MCVNSSNFISYTVFSGTILSEGEESCYRGSGQGLGSL